MVTIDYDAIRQRAIISADALCPPAAWAEVRRVCEERGLAVQNESSTMVTLPWWNFLVFRRDFGYVLRKIRADHGVELTTTASARQLLEAARSRETAYREAQTREPLDVQDIERGLRAQGFTRELKPYQLRNVARLASLPAAATFSVPGAGKTTEALATYFLRRTPETRVLIVGPKNAFAVWEEQLAECAPQGRLRFARLEGGIHGVSQQLQLSPDVSIISYQQLTRAAEPVGAFLTANPCFLFIDESHRMKRGLEGVSGACILGLSHLPAYKLLLTGTPMPNAITDLLPQCSFLYPEIHVSESTVIDQLQPIYVRTTKDELGLPPLRRIRHDVNLSPAQERLYGALTDDVVRRLAGLRAGDRLQFRAFARCVMHLIQAASDPALLATSELAAHPLLQDALAEPSAKIVETCRIARDLASRRQKCVIWSYFVRTVEHLAMQLHDLGAEYIHGGVDTSPDESLTDTREAKIRRFHDDDSCFVLVANPAACSESISLHHVCHHAIYVDRTYNAAQYLQSEDRIHRLGLSPDQHTFITILHAPGTIDESVDRRLAAKVARMGDVLNDPGLNIRPIDLSDESEGIDDEDLQDVRRLLLGDS